MNDKTISRNVFEVLVKHLVDIEELRGLTLNQHYPDITKEREMFENLLHSYTRMIEEFINSAKPTDDMEDACPFIIIGSIVELENLEDGEVEIYQIVSPFTMSMHSDIDAASFLSPVGRELILKKKTDRVVIENPTGQTHYVIRSINIADELLAFIQKEG